MLIGSMIIIGCSKKESASNDNNSSGGGDEPTMPYMIKFKIDTLSAQYPKTDAIKYKITYVVGENDTVVFNNITLPWVSEEIETTQATHTLFFSGFISYDLEDIPDEAFSFTYCPIIYKDGEAIYNHGKAYNFESKEYFIEYIATHPRVGNFSYDCPLK